MSIFYLPLKGLLAADAVFAFCYDNRQLKCSILFIDDS